MNLIDSCIQYEMTNVDMDADMIHIYLSNVLAPRGYVWVFPKGEHRANVGLGIVPQEKKPGEYMAEFLKLHPEISKGSYYRGQRRLRPSRRVSQRHGRQRLRSLR